MKQMYETRASSYRTIQPRRPLSALPTSKRTEWICPQHGNNDGISMDNHIGVRWSARCAREAPPLTRICCARWKPPGHEPDCASPAAPAGGAAPEVATVPAAPVETEASATIEASAEADPSARTEPQSTASSEAEPQGTTSSEAEAPAGSCPDLCRLFDDLCRTRCTGSAVHRGKVHGVGSALCVVLASTAGAVEAAA